jgi:hypothetical protein
MGDIYVNIYEGDAFEKRITLKEINPGVYKLDDPSADPDRIFLRNGSDVSEIVMYALMHLGLRKGK